MATNPAIKKRVREIIRGGHGKIDHSLSWNRREGHHRIFHTSTLAKVISTVIEAVVRDCAEVAKGVKDGFTANIRVSEDEQELVRDPDGPWVLNSDIAKAILKEWGMEE